MAYVSTTCLRAPPEPADRKYWGQEAGLGSRGGQRPSEILVVASPVLTEACKQFGKETLLYLAFLEEEGTRENDGTAMRSCLTKIATIAEVGVELPPGTGTVTTGDS